MTTTSDSISILYRSLLYLLCSDWYFLIAQVEESRTRIRQDTLDNPVISDRNPTPCEQDPVGIGWNLICRISIAICRKRQDRIGSRWFSIT
jgi:hypothetical protein